MKTSLIITTFNWKEALDLVLRSVVRQVVMPDEVIIADDGSRPDTGELVKTWKTRLPVPLLHVWQEDLGFRAARARNLAIAKSSGDYLVMIDGDMVLHAHFLADHKRAASPGHFIQGVRLLAGPELGRRMIEEGILCPGFFTAGIQRRRHALRSQLLSWACYQRKHRGLGGIRSCNQAHWKNDLWRVNGFNEQMTGWGGEDCEIAVRLYHLGLKRRDLRFAALATHIFHPAREAAGKNPNHEILADTIRSGRTRCETGLGQHMAEAFPVKPVGSPVPERKL